VVPPAAAAKQQLQLVAAKQPPHQKYASEASKNNIRLPKLKFKIRKSMSSFKRKPSFLIKLFFKLRRKNISKVFSKKLKIISNILSNKYNKPVEFQLIRTHYPIYDSNILINLLNLNIKNKKKKSKIAIKKIYSSLRGKNAIKVLNDDASRLKKQKRPVFASRAKQAFLRSKKRMRPYFVSEATSLAKHPFGAKPKKVRGSFARKKTKKQKKRRRVASVVPFSFWWGTTKSAATRELAVAVQQLVRWSRSPFSRFATREEARAAAFEDARRELMALPPLYSCFATIGRAKVGGVHAAAVVAAKQQLQLQLQGHQKDASHGVAASRQQHSYYFKNKIRKKEKRVPASEAKQANPLDWYWASPVSAAAANQQRPKKFGVASPKFVATQLVEIPAFLSGLNIKIAGRLMKEPILPRRTTKKKVKGATATGKVNFLDIATIKNKNKKGAYTITIKSGHNFF
jgi:Mitochondrial ribosomal protein (VAR1)